MTRTEFFSLSLITTLLFVLAVSLYFIAINAPTVFDVPKIQNAYEHSIKSPKSLSEEEVTKVLKMHIRAQKFRHDAEKSALKAIKSLSIILATLAGIICLIMISIYRRKKHENS